MVDLETLVQVFAPPPELELLMVVCGDYHFIPQGYHLVGLSVGLGVARYEHTTKSVGMFCINYYLSIRLSI